MESTVIITFWTQLGSVAALVISLFYLNHQNVADRQKSDDRWANLKTEMDNRWTALKTESDSRWAEGQKQWAEGQKEITALMRRMNMIEDGQKRG